MATIITNDDGEMQMINKQAEMLFGWSRDDLLGQPVEKLIPEDRREWHRKVRAEYVKTPRQFTIGDRQPLTCRRKDGSTFKAEIGLAPLHTDEGMLVMVNLLEV